MKYCIYKGDLYEVADISGGMVHFKDNWGNSCALIKEVLEVTQEDFKAVEEEFRQAKNEINSIKDRMYKLDEAYRQKTEALRTLMSENRQKEISVISRLINQSQRRNPVEREMD